MKGLWWAPPADPPSITKAATLSPCGLYRYSLQRTWDAAGPPLVWVMLNPSTADANIDDPTIRRVVSFSQRGGQYGGAIVVNLYALRATNPKALGGSTPPVGPDNDACLAWYARSGWHIVAAWGAHPTPRSMAVLSGPFKNRPLLCLGKTKDGHPRHPLYVKGDQPFEVYR